MHPGSRSRRTAGGRCAAGRRCRSRGWRGRRHSGRNSCGRSSRVTLARSCGLAAGSRLSSRRSIVVATAKIGHIPARALELKARCRQLLGERGSAAGGAHGQGIGRHFLQHILGVAAGVAFVGVNRHGGYLGAKNVGNRGANAKPSIIGSPLQNQGVRLVARALYCPALH